MVPTTSRPVAPPLRMVPATSRPVATPLRMVATTSRPVASRPPRGGIHLAAGRDPPPRGGIHFAAGRGPPPHGSDHFAPGRDPPPRGGIHLAAGRGLWHVGGAGLRRLVSSAEAVQPRRCGGRLPRAGGASQVVDVGGAGGARRGNVRQSRRWVSAIAVVGFSDDSPPGVLTHSRGSVGFAESSGGSMAMAHRIDGTRLASDARRRRSNRPSRSWLRPRSQQCPALALGVALPTHSETTRWHSRTSP